MTAVLPGISETALAITMGARKLLSQMGLASVPEFKLPNGRRADLAALGRSGEFWLIEVKSCVTDFRSDGKWPEYRPFADRFFFAVQDDFPRDMIPEDCGLILADAYGGWLARMPDEHKLNAARRKALTLKFGRTAAMRLWQD